jgi:predicted nucleic acid-binding protein
VILVDSSVWIDHLHTGGDDLAALLDDGSVLGHPWVTGELALGQLSAREEVLGLLANLPQATVASAGEVMELIETRRLHGLGIGYVDAHLVASTLLTSDTRLWTCDKRLAAVAASLRVAATVPSQS